MIDNGLDSSSLSGRRSASTFPTSGCCCALPAETVSAAAASSPPGDRPSPANQSAKATTSPATPPCLRANQWVYLISNMVCRCLALTLTNASTHWLTIWVCLCFPFPFSGSLLRRGGGHLITDARQSPVILWCQTGASYQPEVKGERSQHGRVWQDRRPQPHRPGHMSPLADHSEYQRLFYVNTQSLTYFNVQNLY